MIIRVCDDEADQRETWARAIADALGTETTDEVVQLGDPGAAVGELLQRQEALRAGDPREDQPCDFDGTDVLVVDYDLVLIDAKKARHTGEEFARLGRLYSDVRYIIVMNQGNSSIDFDLTMTGRPQSYADLNIPSKTVGTPALWRSVGAGEFCPWQWDEIDAITSGRKSLVDDLAKEGGLSNSILDYVECPDDVIALLSDAAYEFLDPSADTPGDLKAVTFDAFLHRTTEHKDVAGLIEHRRRRATSVAVARLGKWLSRMLLGPQEVLVDVPHLLQRCPFLLNPEAGSVEDPATWNKALKMGLGAIAEPIHECAFLKSPQWIGRESFWWPMVTNHRFFEEIRAKFDYAKTADVVFAEDISLFIPFNEAREYRAGFHNQYDNRYIKGVDGVQYGPSRRLKFD